jgi:hypothetical protein
MHVIFKHIQQSKSGSIGFNAVFLTIACIYYLHIKDKIDRNVFLMVSFKIFLTLFLAFIVIPYKYLMITQFFVSIGIYDAQRRYSIVQTPT